MRMHMNVKYEYMNNIIREKQLIRVIMSRVLVGLRLTSGQVLGAFDLCCVCVSACFFETSISQLISRRAATGTKKTYPICSPQMRSGL